MKKVCLVLLAGWFALGAAAQNRSIVFEDNQEWNSVLEKARKEKRLIFMDCYTTWCGPCKMLAEKVFTNDEIADYYNAHFVNAKYDMEKGDGLTLRAKYGITAYPTLLFIDPQTLEVVHRVAGAGDVAHNMEQARIATDPAGNLQSIKAQFDKNEKTAASVSAYMKVLGRAGMSGEQNNVAADYLAGLAIQDLARAENWDIFERYVTDPLSEPAKTVFANRGVFEKAAGAEKVDRKLSSTLMIAVNRFRNKEPEPVADFDQQRYDALLALLTTVDDAAAPGCLAQLHAAGYAQARQYDKMIATLCDVVDRNLIDPQLRSIFLMTYMTKLIGRTDENLQRQAVALMNKVIDATDPGQQMSYLRIKALMLRSYGDETGAAEADLQVKKLQESGVGKPIMMKMG